MYKVLIVESVEAVADLQILMLIRSGVALKARRVATPEEFSQQIELSAPDAILYSACLPQFGASEAFAMARVLCPDAALIFVSGMHADTTIGRPAAPMDENILTTSLSKLPATFERAVREAGERRNRKARESAIARLTRVYADQVRELEKTNRQHVTMRKLCGYLQASVTQAEVFAALECFGPQLFPGTRGRLYLDSLPGKTLESVSAWGEASRGEATLAIQDCWALRQAQAHCVRDPRTELLCGHIVPDPASGPPYMCIPLFAQGETLGLLHLRRAGEESRDASGESGLKLAQAVADEVGLALAALKVRSSLRQQSIRDPLTGLYNRRFLEEFLLRELARADRKKHPLSIITLDIDHFKRINDTLGHAAGDIALRRVGLLLQGFVRQSDIACRVGGEEFSVLLPEASLQIAAQRAEDIRKAVQDLKLKFGDVELGAITVSLGVAAFPEHGTSVDALIHAADQALYDAKGRGRDRVVSAA
jgi:diguanylate cyclase (GGDEF)-like protein